MNEIDNITLDPSLPSLRFHCDLNRCKGACCTLPGGRGAPLMDEEIEVLSKAYPLVKHHLTPEHQEAVSTQGLFEGGPGDYFTTCVDHKACVFVMNENGVAKCSLEHAYLKGEISWRKPLSCHLFPLRLDWGPPARLRFEYLPNCEPAFDYGASTETYLSDFVSDALKRAFGEDWVDRFREVCSKNRGSESMP